MTSRANTRRMSERKSISGVQACDSDALTNLVAAMSDPGAGPQRIISSRR
jgi:hypothetical protein